MRSSVQGRELADLQEEGVVDNLSGSVERDMEFYVSVCEEFPVNVQVLTLTHVLLFLQKLTDFHVAACAPARPGSKVKAKTVCDLDISNLDPQQLRLFHFHLTKLIPVLLTKQQFVTQVVEHFT